MPTSPSSPSPWQVWLLAARPRTLPAAAAPVLAGAALAAFDGVFQPGPALAALGGALLLQIGANLANDVFDFQKGADTQARLGPLRVTAAGLLTPRQVLTGMWVTFGLATLLGGYLAWVGGWPIIAIGLTAILAAIAYTGGPFPFGYHGLGEVFVFLFFGLAAVAGTYFVQAGAVSALAWWTAAPLGFLVTAIIVVNNLRDVETDRAAGKRTLAVRLGAAGARWEYLLLIAAAYLAPLLIWASGQGPAGVLLTWVSLPRAAQWVRVVFAVSGRPLNAALGGTGQLALLYALLYSAGLLAARWLG
ncbi:MAG: 1,4-dihydroxy-2-naphthoate polyprenyltransferase [Anaerolineales bacterium]|nr:1,4-dihydroxy-2-naphthoate polyprenyltransferase [Anaerolineales bacterium]